MNAYSYLKEFGNDDIITESSFNQLIKDFQGDYLKTTNYKEGIRFHRHPIELQNELLNKLNRYCLEIQARDEMRDVETETDSHGYVPAKIREIWKSDKRIKSLYNSVKIYCEQRKKDLNVIAIHMAEYRAMVKLYNQIQRQINKPAQLQENKKKGESRQYTFEDWVGNKFYNEENGLGNYVANDSENYLHLVSVGKMSYDELNKIQDAQQKAFDYMIEYSVRLNDRQFQRQTKGTLDLHKVIEIKIEELQKYFTENHAIYKEALLPKLHRAIKYGAKFMLPKQYEAYLNKGVSDVYYHEHSPYMLNINNVLTSFPTTNQMRHAVMEVQIRWFKILQGYKSKLKFDEMMSSNDFKMLIENYGEGDKLLEDYLKGLNFAPDRQLFIANRIKTYESIMPRYQSAISAWDRQASKEIIIQTGEYRRIGYAWVNNGHNAGRSDLETITLRNVTLCPNVPPEGHYAIYINVLYQLATGGAIAFHLAFLREQLNGRKIAKSKKPETKNFWKGTKNQKVKLFELLVAESFVQNSATNKVNFFNNKVVLWEQDARSLFYLLDQLKQKKYSLVDRFESVGSIVRENFVDKNGNPFKNVNQNISGMNNANKRGKPRLAGLIEEILQKL